MVALDDGSPQNQNVGHLKKKKNHKNNKQNQKTYELKQRVNKIDHTEKKDSYKRRIPTYII